MHVFMQVFLHTQLVWGLSSSCNRRAEYVYVLNALPCTSELRRIMHFDGIHFATQHPCGKQQLLTLAT